ncbi:hypothetical protein [Streptomyces sp. NBC_00715]|uniref:hypothetical protein n=1 Tax=Streptomyces sp. NBC_00715 TaxID=2975811 RepID=UPI0038704D2C
MRIFMQPARRSDRTVERHYQDTIVRPVVFDEHADLLDAVTLQRLRRRFPGGSAAMWGVMPGKTAIEPSTRTPRTSAPGTCPASWPVCGTSPSASTARAGTPTSQPPSVTPPETTSGPSPPSG